MNVNDNIKILIQNNDLTNLKIQLDSLNEISTFTHIFLYSIKNEASLEVLNLLSNYIDNNNVFDNFDTNDIECFKTIYKRLIFNNSFIADFINYIKNKKENNLANETIQNELNNYFYKIAIQNNFYLVKYLITYENESSLKTINSQYKLLLTAIEKNQILIVKYFIEHGFNVNEEKTTRRESVLYLVFKNNHLGIANYLINNSNLIINDQEIFDIIKLAIRTNNFKIFESLIENGINIIDKKDKYSGNNALHLAIKDKKIECINYLIENGVNVNEKNKAGKSPLFLAYDNHDIETIHNLIIHNANINDINNEGKTLLFLATKDNEIDLVKFLIDNDANVNVKDNDGYTPLMIASQERYFQVVRWLVIGGANLNEKNKYHDTALYYSSPNYGYKKEIYNILKVRGAI